LLIPEVFFKVKKFQNITGTKRLRTYIKILSIPLEKAKTRVYQNKKGTSALKKTPLMFFIKRVYKYIY